MAGDRDGNGPEDAPREAQRQPLPILRTKLHRPMAAADLVCRDRLLERMGRALEVPLTLVSAPAGYGKTVLVSRWAKRQEHPSAWLSLDEGESDLTVFLAYLLAAVDTVSPGACRATDKLLLVPQLPPVSVVADRLINELDAIDTPCAIVLDDYHRTRPASPVHQVVERLIEHPPWQLHLVLITRRDPPFSLAGLRARDRVTEVRLQDLQFTAPETAEFLARATELAVGPRALANLQREVEGWPVGLRLVSLALRHVADPDAFLEDLHGGLPYTQDLLREVLAGQPPEVRRALLETSILARFRAELVEAVCRFGESPAATGRRLVCRRGIDRRGSSALPGRRRRPGRRGAGRAAPLRADEHGAVAPPGALAGAPAGGRRGEKSGADERQGLPPRVSRRGQPGFCAA